MRPPSLNVSVITGASGGIGEALARRLAAQGSDVVLVARRRDDLERIAGELRAAHGIEADVVPADLTTDEGIGTVERAIVARGPDLLVNNAGYGVVGPFVDGDVGHLDGMVRLNVLALTRLTRAALPLMVGRGSGAIVNVGSIAGEIAGPNLAVYSATKAYVRLFTESLAEELRGTGVHVQALLPGITRTGFQEVAGDVGNTLPDFLWQDADEVAAACLAGLKRGEVVTVSGVHNKAFVAGASALPPGLARRIAGITSRARGRDSSPV